MQIKTTMRHLLTPVRVVIIKEATNNKNGEAVGRGSPLLSRWECELVIHRGEQCRGSLKNKIELPYDAAIPSWVFI